MIPEMRETPKVCGIPPKVIVLKGVILKGRMVEFTPKH